jgi:16S rRNA processing protein RimM
MTPPIEPITVAKIVSAHGVRGELRAYPETDFPERLRPGRAVYIAGVPAPRWSRIRSARPGKPPLLLVRLDGVDGRDAAEALRGGELQVAAADLPPLPEGSYYLHQIVGLRVLTEEGRELGVVTDVEQPGGNDVYVVGPYLIPAVREVVREIDLAGGRMVIRPLPGLLEP